jgi:hypothetical protein
LDFDVIGKNAKGTIWWSDPSLIFFIISMVFDEGIFGEVSDSQNFPFLSS